MSSSNSSFVPEPLQPIQRSSAADLTAVDPAAGRSTRSLYLVDPITPAARLFADIVASAQPSEVFASLAELVVPTVSQACTIVLAEGDQASLRIENPATDKATLAGPRTVEVVIDAKAETFDYRGLVIFGWSRRRPTDAERAVCELLVSHCISLITQHALANTAANLEIALNSNRRIGTALGILMASCKITEQQAFAALRARSQLQHRKLRDVAEDVLETGWLEGFRP